MATKIVRKSKTKSKLPPGPWRLPLLGNLHQLVGSLPHHSLGKLAKKYGPLMHLQLGEVSNIIVSSPEMAKEVMKTHDIIFASRPYLLAAKILSYDTKGIAFSPYGSYWREIRKMCMVELLSVKRVESFRSIREVEVSNLIKMISANEGSPINLSEKFFQLAYGITSRAALGKTAKDHEAFISIVNEGTKLASGFCVADMFPSIEVLQVISSLRHKLEKLHQGIDQILQKVLNEHKDNNLEAKKGDGKADKDIVDVLLRLQRHGDLEHPLTDNSIKAVLLDIFSAGSETSSTTLEWAMSEMVKNPQVMEKAQAEVRQVFDGKAYVDETYLHELKFLRSVIKETLRLHPTIPLLLPRECSESCDINGYKIPVKTKVIVNAWAIGRDPRYWTEAEKFYPERFLNSSIDYKGTDFEYIPFGAGRRMCPGITFAMANIELPLAQLLYHFDWKLPNGLKQEDLDMTEEFGLSLRRKNNLHLIPMPYHPLSVK
uniref:Cytochrome P450 n=2 Tax=Quercus lobata TaxID=97700 RepID=A0A7N2M8Q0_QUELO